MRQLYEEQAKERQRQHGGTAPGRAKSLQANLPEVISGRQARDDAGRAVGVGSRTFAHATAIKVDAMALMGEFLKVAEKNTGSAGMGRPSLGGSTVEPPKDQTPTLADVGITKKESSVAQALATVKEEKPEVYASIRAGRATTPPISPSARRCGRVESI